jgi:AcrB/AcrD/AcrF family
MWIVRLSLRRPYTFVVLALLIAVLGVASILTMLVDVFPAINIPVVTVIWSYSGLCPTEMQNRIVNVSERAFTTTVKVQSGQTLNNFVIAFDLTYEIDVWGRVRRSFVVVIDAERTLLTTSSPWRKRSIYRWAPASVSSKRSAVAGIPRTSRRRDDMTERRWMPLAPPRGRGVMTHVTDS